MKQQAAIGDNVVAFPATGRVPRRRALVPLRPPFHELLGDAAWFRLPAPVRARFSHHPEPGETRVFTGEVVETHMSRAGWLLSQAARVVGAPLPLVAGGVGPATVSVTDDDTLGAQIWTRIYARPGKFPQVIHSAKRLSGPTGLEECLGAGLLMRLELVEEDGAVVFRSSSYAIEAFARTWQLPTWMTPGRCDVIHRDVGGGQFTFTLQLQHPWWGLLMRQVGLFRELDRSDL